MGIIKRYVFCCCFFFYITSFSNLFYNDVMLYLYIVCTVIKTIGKHFTLLVVSHGFVLITYAGLYYVSLSSLFALRFWCQLYSIPG